MSAGEAIRRMKNSQWSTAAAVFAAAAALRLGFALLTARTFDPDEFVVLTLSKSVATGAVPYRDVVFFHPPGMLLLFAALNRVVTWWWPAGRIITLLVDSVTAVCVWRIGRECFGRTQGLVAGALYAASPIALVSAVRIGPDPLITAFGTLGLALLLTTRGRAALAGAALCLALAVWTKYSALLYLPVYLMAAPHRIRYFLLIWAGAAVCLFAPFLPEAPAMVNQTILWQLGRAPADLLSRLRSVGTYWLLLNPLSLVALWRSSAPRWLVLGFGLGGVFLLTPQAYYHYFAIIAPFASLLAAPFVTRIARRTPRRLITGMLSLTALWGLDIAYGSGPVRLHVVAARLSDAQQVASILDSETRGNSAVLADRLEYTFLAHRIAALNYFWDMNRSTPARRLEGGLDRVAAVVQTKGPDTFPPGFTEYLRRERYRSRQTGLTIIWSTSRRSQPVEGQRDGPT